MRPIFYSALRRSLTLCLFLITITSSESLAQKQANVWYFDRSTGLDFNVIPPATRTLGTSSGIEGTSSICDPITGRLLFYTDGIKVWDANNNVMAGGALSGGSSSTQAALIVPEPGNTGRYYIFTTDELETSTPAEPAGGFTPPRYSVVNMNPAPGSLASINNSLPGEAAVEATEQVAATRHANGTDYWVVFHQWNTNSFLVYRLTNAGLGSVSVQNVGTVVSGASKVAKRGELKFSPDGSWLAAAHENLASDLFRFDNATGAITLVTQLDNGVQHYGVSFSPDNSKLYVDNGWNGIPGSIAQYDLSNPTAASILASRTVVGTSSNNLGSMQIAPDGRIYVVRVGQSTLGVINCPNLSGSSSGWVENGFPLGAGASTPYVGNF